MLYKSKSFFRISLFLIAVLARAQDFKADHQIEKISEISAIVEKISTGVHSSRVWVIFDLDETLFRSKTALGSETFFIYQDGLLKDKSNNPYKMAQDFSELLKIQGEFIEKGELVPVDDTVIPTLVELNAKNYSTMIFTARGPGEWPATQRELNKNATSFASRAPRLKVEFNNQLPFLSESVDTLAPSPEEKAALGFDKSGRKVSYFEGVFLTEGQNKGGMLRVFINESQETPIKVIFVENSLKNLKRSEDAAKNKDFEVISVFYKSPKPFFTEEQIQAEITAYKNRSKN